MFIEQNEKFFVAVQPKNAFKLEFVENLWLPFFDQPQSNIVVHAIITFQIYNILVTKFKREIGANDIINGNK